MSPAILLFAAALFGDPIPRRPRRHPGRRSGARQGRDPRVALETSLGRFVVELDPRQGAEVGRELPRLRQVGLLRRHDLPSRHQGLHGPGRRLHRRHEAEGDPGRRSSNEADNGLKNQRGTLAMARTKDPNSATSQFFVNRSTTPSSTTPARTRAAGAMRSSAKVVEGMDVVDKIAGGEDRQSRASSPTCRRDGGRSGRRRSCRRPRPDERRGPKTKRRARGFSARGLCLSRRGLSGVAGREVVPKAGLEPARVTPHAPQTCASTNSATSARAKHRCVSESLAQFGGVCGAGCRRRRRRPRRGVGRRWPSRRPVPARSGVGRPARRSELAGAAAGRPPS